MSSPINTIYLDMDGVCCNFGGAAMKACGRSYDTAIETWDFFKEWGWSIERFWQAIDAQGEDLWANLEPFPWFIPLLKHCEDLVGSESIWYCSTPSQAPWSASGKLKWLRRIHGKDFRRWILIPDKTHLAAPDRLLIDDSGKNCDAFRKAGGHAILFPQPWNDAKGTPPLAYHGTHRWLQRRLEAN